MEPPPWMDSATHTLGHIWVLLKKSGGGGGFDTIVWVSDCLLLFPSSHSSVCVCLSSPGQPGLPSRLLWSLHHNYRAVGTGETRDGGKKEEWKKWQMKCRSVEMCSGQFLSLSLAHSLSLSLSLSPWAIAKEARRGERCLSPTPVSLSCLPLGDMDVCPTITGHSVLGLTVTQGDGDGVWAADTASPCRHMQLLSPGSRPPVPLSSRPTFYLSVHLSIIIQLLLSLLLPSNND